MLYRIIATLVVITLTVSLVPFSSTTVMETEAQSPGLQLSQTKVELPDGGRTLTLSGQYQIGNQTVKLRGLTTATNLAVAGGITPAQNNPDAPEENEFRPQEDYYYSYSDMSRSDGTPLVQARYEYQEPTDRSILYITAAGVTVTVDFNNVDFDSLSDADAERLDTWVGSDEGRLVERNLCSDYQ